MLNNQEYTLFCVLTFKPETQETVMKVLFKLILIVGVSLYLVLPALAIEFFDINKPKIEKLNLSINKSGDSELVDLLVEQLRNQMPKTLLFNIVEDSAEPSFNP